MLRYAPNLGVNTQGLSVAPTTSQGRLLSAAATATTKGAWNSLGTVTFPYHFISIQVATPNVAGEFLIDIGVDDGSGNKWIIVPDLRFCAQRGANGAGIELTLPLYIPSGFVLHGRCSSDKSSGTVNVSFMGHSSGFQGAPGFSQVLSLYTPVLSGNLGMAVDPGAVANTNGSWVQTSAGVARRLGGFFVILGSNGGTKGLANYLIDVGIGPSGARQVVRQNVAVCTSVNSVVPLPSVLGPYPYDIPANTPIVIRASSNFITATTRVLDAAVYGLAA